MTRKDYYLIVKVLRDLPRVGTVGQYVPYESIIGAMCKEFEDDNPRFNRGEFVAACYPDDRIDKR